MDIPNIEEMIDRAKAIRMSPGEEEEQRRSFAYGNAKTENDRVTRDMVDRAAQKHVRS